MANAVFAGAARQLVSNVSPLATTLRVVPAGEHEQSFYPATGD